MRQECRLKETMAAHRRNERRKEEKDQVCTFSDGVSFRFDL